MKITLLCKECHETEYKLISEVGKVKFQCKNCGAIKNELKIGKNEIYPTKCRGCGSEGFKIRVNKEEGSATIQCRSCGSFPEKMIIEESQVAVTTVDLHKEKREEKVVDNSLIIELKNEIIRLKNRVEELERKSEIESKKVQEVKGDYYYLEHIIKKLKF